MRGAVSELQIVFNDEYVLNLGSNTSHYSKVYTEDVAIHRIAERASHPYGVTWPFDDYLDITEIQYFQWPSTDAPER